MKRNKLLKLLWVVVLVAVLLSGLVLSPVAGGTLREGGGGPGIVLRLALPPYEIVQDGEGFDAIRVEGFSSFGLPGDPVLPRGVYHVAIPPAAAPGSLGLEVVDVQEVKLPGAYRLEPATPDLAGDGSRAPSGAYPAAAAPGGFVALLPPGQLRRYRFARVAFTPFRYDAASGELSVAREVTVRVTYGAGPEAPGTALLGDRVMDDLARRLLVNYDEAQAWYRAPDAPGGPGVTYDYVIITTNTIESNSTKLADFIAHKQSLGYSVLTVTEDDYGGLTGQPPNGRAEKVRRWLIDHYAAYSIRYVLLIGDPTPAGSDSIDLPMKMCWPIYNDPYYGTYQSPTDYFYADLTGNWDLDGDMYYGEWDDYAGGGVDLAPEVYVGRIPFYGNYADLDGILQKIMDYETEPDPESWRRSALLPMSFSTETYDGAPLAEQMMDDYLDSAGFSSWTQYQQGGGACGLDSFYSSDQELRGGIVVRDRWASVSYGLVVWWGHGSQISAAVGCEGCWDGPLFDISQTSPLGDDHPAFTYQNSCTNGYPERSDNLQYALLKRGAVATVGASRVSWFNTGVGYGQFDGSTTNSGIGYEYASRLVQGEQPGGDALYNAKSSMMPEFKTRLMNFYDFNLYGDPSLPLIPRVAVSGVTIEGPELVTVDGEWTYRAAAQPPTATLPISYTWDNGLTGATAAYSWTITGTYTIVVTATNGYGEAQGALEVEVLASWPHSTRLPLVLREE